MCVYVELGLASRSQQELFLVLYALGYLPYWTGTRINGQTLYTYLTGFLLTSGGGGFEPFIPNKKSEDLWIYTNFSF